MARSCKVCKERYEPVYNTLQPTCGQIPCAMTYGRKQQEKARKITDKAFKKKVRDNDRSWHIKTLQIEFNKFIRLRDKGNDCISCGKSPKKINAGHYRSTGAAPELRFNESNVHLQCEPCNSYMSGNIENYRKNLISKIGLSAVIGLEGPHEPKKYTIDELKGMIADYRDRNKRLD